jgi:hypothetical protein
LRHSSFVEVLSGSYLKDHCDAPRLLIINYYYYYFLAPASPTAPASLPSPAVACHRSLRDATARCLMLPPLPLLQHALAHFSTPAAPAGLRSSGRERPRAPFCPFARRAAPKGLGPPPPAGGRYGSSRSGCSGGGGGRKPYTLSNPRGHSGGTLASRYLSYFVNSASAASSCFSSFRYFLLQPLPPLPPLAAAASSCLRCRRCRLCFLLLPLPVV